MHNLRWLQIKADISGYPHQPLYTPEATLVGAAFLAGMGCGYYSSAQAATLNIARGKQELILPDPDRHTIYQRIFDSYMAFQVPLRAYFNNLQKP